jgi:hypothetical protein
MGPVCALVAAFNQLFFSIHAVRGIVQNPILQLTASIFNFREDDVLSLHPGLDACRGETGQGEVFSLKINAIPHFSFSFSQLP